MVLAALASFAILLVAWIVAPGERRRTDTHDEQAAQPVAVAAWPRG